jgi:heme-degrading monooxygenase HmoA
MYARVTTLEIRPGTTDGLMPLYEAAAHQEQGMKGFVSTQLLTNRTANRAMIVTIFETLADLEASAIVPQQAQANPQVAAALAGPPVIALYEVAVQVTAHQ